VKLRLERTWCGLTCTIGTLSIDGANECFTLEDRVRPQGAPKVPKQTAIPFGTYNVVVTPSQRFKRDLPLLENVPDFTGVRIHPGNTAEDTEGCILVGRAKWHDHVSESKLAFEALFKKIKDALARGETVTLEIV
jgi:Steigviridae/Suoliviridae L,D-carboxypeptidase/transpeptidase